METMILESSLSSSRHVLDANIKYLMTIKPPREISDEQVVALR